MNKLATSPLEHQFLFREGDYLAEMCLEEESLELAYHLRYLAYQQAEAIVPNSEERFVDPYDQQANTRTYLIWHLGKPVASVRSHTYSAAYQWEMTPSVRYFQEAIREHLGAQVPLLESNRYVVHPEFQGRQSFVAQLLLFRIQSIGATTDQCEHVITAVRPRHARFYERFMNFKAISDAIEVTEVEFPIQLLSTPTSSQEKLAQSNALAAYQPADVDRYKGCLEYAKRLVP